MRATLELSDHANDSHNSPDALSPLERLRHAIDHAAHLLPAQGPIQVFIHHNTLHAFEHLPFDDAVQRGAAVFGTQPYLSEEKFRAALGRGRIRVESLRELVEQELGSRAHEVIAGSVTRFQLRMTMLEHALWAGTAAELSWWMAESAALKQFTPDSAATTRNRLVAETRRWVMRDGRNGSSENWLSKLKTVRINDIEQWSDSTWQAATLEGLWSVCCAGAAFAPNRVATAPKLVRHRDVLNAVTGHDCDLDVNDVLIRFSAAFVDQGVSHWSLPDRKDGFFAAFLRLYRMPYGPPNPWLRPLRVEAERLLNAKITPLQFILDSLEVLGVAEPEWDEYLSDTLLALRGWGGIIRQMEERADRGVAHAIPTNTLLEFLAVRLLLDRLAVTHLASEEGYTGSLAKLQDEFRLQVPAVPLPTPEERAIVVFQLAQLLGWTPHELEELSPDQWRQLHAEVEAFHPIERRRLFHRAYEIRFRNQTLDALSLHVRRPVSRPRFQVITCLDEREESFRRHLEEVAPDCETFGAAGFFNVVMYYRGVAEARYAPLCPVVVRPKHWVKEQSADDHEGSARRAQQARRALGRTAHQIHVGTRGFALGAVISATFGVLATFPLVARVLFPRLTARLHRRAAWLTHAPKKTRLRLERADADAGPDGQGVGFTVEEMTGIAGQLLRDIGLTRNFARLVFTLGHGSHSMNNPHESAHDCGACGGNVGGPNGRVVAKFLNDPRVRAGLAARGLAVPADTVFVGGLHNTSNEYVKFADTDVIPESHRAEYEATLPSVEAAVARNAHERARRFQSAPLDITPAGARQHVDDRAEDLAQVRPEWGHATNAICIVGRRERTRGLFLDRRPFLTSYDPTQDDATGSTLMRLLGAAVPVCAGINLEYYFCHIDSPGYGSGTKLPHNITSLLGVMDGAASDLRTGLPWQMVEIHEPVRLLFVVETTPDVILGIMARSEVIGRMVRNGWVQMTVLDPDSGAIQIYQDGRFQPYTLHASHLPKAPTSADWYRGWRDHLEFAVIG